MDATQGFSASKGNRGYLADLCRGYVGGPAGQTLLATATNSNQQSETPE